MKVASNTPLLLRPYSVANLVDDASVGGALRSTDAGTIGRALLKNVSSGAGIVIAEAQSSNGTPIEVDYKKLAKGVAAIAGETLTGKAVAKSAWHLSSLSSTTTPDKLAEQLISNHISPEKAKAIATEVLKVLHDPVSRGILISISAGAATYIVVQRTSLSRGRKWAIILAAAALAGATFALLYFLQIAQ